MMAWKEKPGASIPFSNIQALLPADERFEVEKTHWKGFLFAPKNITRLSALLYLMQEQKLPFAIMGIGSETLKSPAAPFLVSTRALKQVSLLGDSVEVEAGCDLRTLHSELFSLGYEIALEDHLYETDKRSVASAILRRCQSGLVLRQCPTQQALLSIELALLHGGIVRLGRSLEAASTLPLHQLVWGMNSMPAIIVKTFWKVYKIPKLRLALTWVFNDSQSMEQQLSELQQFTTSWERLDSIVSGRHGEKAFLLAQISGIEEEMNAFKLFCPGFKQAIVEDYRKSLLRFFSQQKMFFQPIQQRYSQSLPSSHYEWYHHLVHQGWLIGPERGFEKPTSLEPIWKQRFFSCLQRY